MIRAVLAILFCLAFGGQAFAQATCVGNACPGGNEPYKTVNDVYVKGVIEGINTGLFPLLPVQVATVTVLPFTPTYSNPNQTLIATANGALVINGYSVAFGDRVLVKNQALPFQNGIYKVVTTGSSTAPYQLVRDIDMTTGNQLFHGVSTVDQTGGASWVFTTDGPIVIGSTPLTWGQYTQNGLFSQFVFPVISPSSPGSPGWTGPGCTQGTANAIFAPLVTTSNWCTHFNSWTWVSDDPSADAVFTLTGSCTPGDVISFTLLITGKSNQTVTYTVGAGCSLATVANGLVTALKANSALYTSPNGGYAAGSPLAYIVGTGNGFAFDYDSKLQIQWQYSITGAGTEVITSNGGWYAGPLYTGGTTGGMANAQTLTGVPGFAGALGSSVSFTAGISNTTGMTLNINGTGALSVKKYNATGTLVNLASGDITLGNTYVVNNGPGYVLNMNAEAVNGGSSQATAYQLPNALDNNQLIYAQRTTGNSGPANNSAGSAPGSFAFNIQNGCSDSNATSTFTANVLCSAFALTYLNMTAGHVQSAWFIEGTNPSAAAWFVSDGIWPSGGCSYNFQPGGCGFHDMGAATFNGSGFCLNDSCITGSFAGAATGTATAWTPADVSGASLTFTSVSANWQEIGRMMFVYGQLTYPNTADGTTAAIGGLPIQVPSAHYAQQCSVSYATSATGVAKALALTTGGNNLINLYTSTGSAVTNANMSLSTISFMCIYPTI